MSIETRPTRLVSGQDCTFLAMYARLAHATGDTDRARELIDLTLPREGLDFLLICETEARIEDWPNDEFCERSADFRRRLLDFPEAVERVNSMVMRTCRGTRPGGSDHDGASGLSDALTRFDWFGLSGRGPVSE